ncbi:MAG TPA: hypothetical protein VHQ90_08375 [Thermoanaerobaculia bacterium]|nr:hypothetical protein [Thermoanaerobaculia bacterium]
MNARRRLHFCLMVVGALWPAAAGAQAQVCSSPYYVEQSFPTAGPEQTRWKLCWQVLNGPNLVITGAWFRPDPAAQWIKLIYDARVSQLFVPYHPGAPRYKDVNYGFGSVPLARWTARHREWFLARTKRYVSWCTTAASPGNTMRWRAVAKSSSSGA